MCNVDLSKYRVRGNGSIPSNQQESHSASPQLAVHDSFRQVKKGGFLKVFGKSLLFLYIMIMRLALRSGWKHWYDSVVRASP